MLVRGGRLGDQTPVSFITSNENKFMEMKEFFNSNSLELEWIERSLPEIQANTLEEVVEYSLSQVGLENVFIEDAGVFIDSLDGFPGVYSRYIYDTIGNKGILRLLEGEKNRTARFEALIGFKESNKEDIKLFKGVVKGSVSPSCKGNMGFGYDPIFIPEGFINTFGEDKNLKSEMSHRIRAAEKLINYLQRNK